VRVPGERRERCVRVATSGEPPGPTAHVTEIDDPFAAARDEGVHVHGLIGALRPRAGGLIDAPLAALELRPPVRPGKIIGVGRNFRAHAAELGNEVPSEPLLFLKPASALLPAGAPIVLPASGERVDMEGELVVVIGADSRPTDDAAAWACVGGYTLGNDVTNRVQQRADKQWTRAKGGDGFAPCGPWIRVTPPGCECPVADLRVRSYVDDELAQDGGLELLIFPIPAVLRYLAASMTLEAGDLIYTGTPEGVRTLAPGQRLRVELGVDAPERAAAWQLAPLVNGVVAASR
jgi:2-keto-4-pentenoate hydratase/2-oxohepta-3-ene-1,7-dioic acid hydratase in catechol pathway